MRKELTFLGIETSCDETAASVVQEKTDGTGKILEEIKKRESNFSRGIRSRV